MHRLLEIVSSLYFFKHSFDFQILKRIDYLNLFISNCFKLSFLFRLEPPRFGKFDTGISRTTASADVLISLDGR